MAATTAENEKIWSQNEKMERSLTNLPVARQSANLPDCFAILLDQLPAARWYLLERVCWFSWLWCIGKFERNSKGRKARASVRSSREELQPWKESPSRIIAQLGMNRVFFFILSFSQLCSIYLQFFTVFHSLDSIYSDLAVLSAVDHRIVEWFSLGNLPATCWDMCQAMWNRMLKLRAAA